jgi:hypothetical protein
MLFLIIVGVVFLGLAMRILLSRTRPKPTGTRARYYIALQIASVVMALLGWVMIAIAVIITFLPTLMGPIPTPGDTVGTTVFGMTVLMGLIAGASAAITGVLLIAGSEMILLFIDVERNTRGAEYEAAETKKAIVALLQAVTKPRAPAQQQRPPVPSSQPVRQST